MPIRGVMRPGHAAIRVLDLKESVEYYVERIGLIKTDEDAQGRVYLKGWDELDCFSLILREADSPGIDYMGFKVKDKSDLDEFEGKLKEFGQNVERIPAGELNKCGERVRFDSPTGHTFELYAEKDYHGDGLGRKNPNPWPEGLKGMQVHRFDHCLIYGPNVNGTMKLFREVLEFDLTEQVLTPDGDVAAAFLSCSNKAHDIAMLEHPEPGKLHHVSFMLMTWEEVLRAADIMSMYDIPIDIGPTRHGITRGQTVYFFDPSGNRNEVFCGDYTWYPDREPITWMPEELGRAIFYHDRKLNENFLGVVT